MADIWCLKGFILDFIRLSFNFSSKMVGKISLQVISVVTNAESLWNWITQSHKSKTPNYHLFMDLIFPCLFTATILDQLSASFPHFIFRVRARIFPWHATSMMCLSGETDFYDLFLNPTLTPTSSVAS